jgi:uncharacterized membrane protein
MDTLHHYLNKLQASLLALPLVMGLVALGAAQLLLDAGQAARPAPPWMFAGSAASARDLLSALLTGIITMFSLVLSITMVVLTLAAQQIGSRLIRSFIDDRVTQAVLGLFLGTLLYLLAVLGAVDERLDDRVPHLAITAGLLLAGLCLPALLFYVDKLARSIVFDHAARRMSLELRRTCQHMQSDGRNGRAADAGRLPADAARVIRQIDEFGEALALGEDGYVQSIAYASLVRVAERADLRIRISVRPGHWVNADTRCLFVAPAPTPALAATLRRAVFVGPDRTPTQDLEYGLERLVEMAVRALSPGLNDVFTAMAAIDNIGASVATVFSRPAPSRVLVDSGRQIRVIRAVSEPAGLLEAAFDQVRQCGAQMPAVAIRLFDALGRLAPSLRSDAQRAAVLDQIAAVLSSANIDRMIAKDAEAVAARHRRARAAIEAIEGLDAADTGGAPPAQVDGQW